MFSNLFAVQFMPPFIRTKVIWYSATLRPEAKTQIFFGVILVCLEFNAVSMQLNDSL